ncbi:MAG: DUF1501 domain-containing protein [Planctomycetes bacterium]|nr:DUF1501 domain-containing protein [Planctomycetota bacterium]
MFFLDGGPSHLETFDPKPDAPAEVRGEFRPIPTSVSGMRIAEPLPLLARQARHYSLVRSLYHGNPSHAPAEHQMLTGWMGSREGTARAVIENPSLGSIVARLAGPRRRGMPAYVAVPWSFHHAYGGSPFGTAAYLGPRYEPLESGPLPCSATAPFEVPMLALREAMSVPRLGTRRALLGRLDRVAAHAAPAGDMQRVQVLKEQALDLLLDVRVREAFELAREPRGLRERYGAHEWGQGALLARRLVEAGGTFVMLQCGLRQDWDTHAANFTKLRDELLPPLDRAVATLIADLVDRGRLQQTLVLVMGEFGRTPVVNKQAGRDHWASVFSALVAGGGLKAGQVVGSSDKTAAYPAHRGLHAQELFATMYHVLGIDPTTLLHDRQGRPIPVLGQGKPIAELL